MCRKDGHYANTCPHLSSYATHKPGTYTELEKAFYAQCHVSTNALDWFVDSGATNHMTDSTNSVTQHAPYDGHANVLFGDDNTLPNSYIGQSVIHNNVRLQDMLVVPNITNNLLSISKLTTDNNVDVLFSRPNFFIQDRATKWVLAKGRYEQGLYVLSLSLS